MPSAASESPGPTPEGAQPRPVIQASVAPRERQDAFQGGQDRGPTDPPLKSEDRGNRVTAGGRTGAE